MAMARYNKSLDYAALALAAAANGDHRTAGRMLLKASTSPDVGRAVQILEASNAQAYDAERAQVRASAGGKAKRATTAKTKVKAFDIGDEDEINDLIEDGVEAGLDDFEVEEDDEEDDDTETVTDSQFAAVLAGMKADGKAAK